MDPGTIYNVTLPGVYEIVFETTAAGGHSIVVSSSLVSNGFTNAHTFPYAGTAGLFTPIIASLTGSASPTTWIHGRVLSTITAPTYFYFSSSGAGAVVPSGLSDTTTPWYPTGPYYIVRISFVKIT